MATAERRDGSAPTSTMAAAEIAVRLTELEKWKPMATKQEVDWRPGIVDTAERQSSE
jgi:hypothetical protein